MPYLKIKSGPEKGKAFEIESDTVTFGRDPQCTYKLLDNGVSREHAEIYKVGEMYFIRDLKSRNGIQVNDVQINDELLRDGDIIKICSYQFLFESSHQVIVDEKMGSEDFYDKGDDPTSTLTVAVKPNISSSKLSTSANKALGRIIPLVKSSEKIDNLYTEALNIIFDYIEIQEAYIFVLEPGQKLTQKAYRKEKGASKGKASKSIVLRALKEKKTVITANAQDDFRFKSEDSIIIKNITSVLCTPLVALGHELGVIYLNNGPTKKPFDDQSSDVMTSVSTHLSLAILAAETKKREAVTQSKTMKLISQMVENAVPALSGAGRRINKVAQALGQQLDFKTPQLNALYLASRLYTMGYLAQLNNSLDIETLLKDTSYVKDSVRLLRENGGFNECLPIIQFHRYRRDGKGKPKEMNIKHWPLESQVLALAVEIDLRVSVALSVSDQYTPQKQIVTKFIEEGKQIVSEPVLKAFEQAYQDGEILED